MDHIVEVVKKSNTAGLNKAQCYEGGKGFQHLNLSFVLGIFLKKLSGVVPTTAGEQKVIDTWDLTSLDGAWLPPIQVKCLGYS